MGWPVVPLGEVARLDLDTVAVDPTESYKTVGVYSFGRGLFDRRPILGSESSYKKFYRLGAEHFVLSLLFGWEGALSRVGERFVGKYVSPYFPTFLCDPERLDVKYLDWFTKRPSVWDALKTQSSGLGDRRRTLKPDHLLSISVSLPPLDEQHRIVAKLDKVAALVEEAKSLRQEIDREMRSLIQSIHFKLSDVSERPFGEFIELWEDRVPIEPTERYPQVGVRGFAGGLFFKNALQGSETKYKTFNRLSEGLLVASQPKGWEGAVAVCDASHEGWYVSPEYRTFRCKGLLDARYLAALLPTPWFQRELTKLTRGQGARRERLRPEMLLNMKIRMPALQAQAAALPSFRRLHDLREEDIGALMPAMLYGIFNAYTPDARLDITGGDIDGRIQHRH